MRAISLLIILVITLTIMASGASFHPCGDPGTSSINTLDVCSSTVPALSSQGDMPCLNAYACCPVPFARHEAAEIVNPLCKPLLIAFQDERPPKV